MLRRASSLLLPIALAAVSLPAVVYVGGDGAGNTTAPADDPGWDNVGNIGNLSGVYLGNYNGNYWVLTAAHVGIGSITLGSNTYSAIAGSGVQLTNTGNPAADLYMFRIDTDPGLPTLDIATNISPTASLTMIGHGLSRSTDLKYWYDDGSTWTEVTSSDLYNRTGYTTSTPFTKRWGTNNVYQSSTLSLGGRYTETFTSVFNSTANEGQAVTGDSGGAAFHKTGGQWQLAGIMIAEATYNDQPSNIVAINDQTIFADLTQYRSQILANAAVPEPATIALLSGLTALAVAGWRRRLVAR